MGPLWSARFVAKVLGNPAVMVAAILTFPWLAYVVLASDLRISDWLRALILLLYGVPVLGSVALRLCRGGEQGPTDVVITETAAARTIVIGNLPLAHAPTELPRAMQTFAKLLPVPRPRGRVIGNPSHLDEVVIDNQATLPQDARVADEPITIPPEAKGLSKPPEAVRESEAPKQ